jgi:hypothetical protein
MRRAAAAVGGRLPSSTLRRAKKSLIETDANSKSQPTNWNQTRLRILIASLNGFSNTPQRQERSFPQNRPGREGRVDCAPRPPNASGEEEGRGAPLRMTRGRKEPATLTDQSRFGANACSSEGVNIGEGIQVLPLRSTEEGAHMKIILVSGLFLGLAGAASAQTADVFVKDDPAQCWLDVKDIVHRRGREVSDDDLNQILRAGHYATPGGDLTLMVQVGADKNKKGEQGCRIYVSIGGEGVLVQKRASPIQNAQGANDSNGMNNIKLANSIASEVDSMRKARDKKDKEKKPAS